MQGAQSSDSSVSAFGQLEPFNSSPFRENPLTDTVQANKISHGKSTELLNSSNPSTSAKSQASSDSDPPSSEALPQKPDFQAVGWTSAEVTAELELRRKTVNPSASNLLGVLLRATCAVSPFRKWLEERRKTLSGQYEQELREASIKEVAELRILNIIKRYYSSEWSYLRPIEFLVKLFKSLDSLEGTTTHTAGSVFSTCINEIAICSLCKCTIHSPLTLIHLRATQSCSFEREIEVGEYLYLPSKQLAAKTPPEDKERYLSILKTQSPKENLQQLLMDCCCRNSDKLKYCFECHRSTIHWEMSELQSLGSGLIVILPQADLTAAKVPESLNLQDCPVAQAVYNLKAVVIEEKISGYETLWTCFEKVQEITYRVRFSSFILFYEKAEAAVEMILKEINPVTAEQLIEIESSKNAQKPQIQPLQEASKETEESKKNATRSTETSEGSASRSRECSGEAAGLEATLLGMFSVKGFAACFDQRLFTLWETFSFLIHLNEIYELYKTKQSLKPRLKEFADRKCFQGRWDLPHNYATRLLAECDSYIQTKSSTGSLPMNQTAADELNKEREHKCAELHDVFSVLINKVSFYPSWPNYWTYYRMLDIPLKAQDNAMRHSSQSSPVVPLECCISQLNEYSYSLPAYNRTKSQLCYIGSALIIRLFEESTSRSSGILARIPRILDMTKYGNITTPVYHLRAIVEYPKNQEKNTFTVHVVDNSEESTQLLDKGYSECLLFFEQEEPIVTRVKTEESQPSVLTSLMFSGRSQTDNMPKRTYENSPEDTRKVTDFRYGLQNLGNTCFMNAALNGLYSLQPFRTYFATFGAHKQDPLLRALYTYCTKYTQERVYSEILYQLKSAISEFGDGRQHCANSYAFKLLMRLDTLMVSTSDTRFSEHFFENKLMQYRSGKCQPLHDAFAALVENLFICEICYNTRRSFSYFRTVDVPIPHRAKKVGELTVFDINNFYQREFASNYIGSPESEDIYTEGFSQILQYLYDLRQGESVGRIDLPLCFEYMLRASLMSSENMMPCSRCERDTQHYKQSFFRQLSTALVIHFQRLDEFTGQKLDTPVAFPTELDMSKYCTNDPRQYVLRGVVYHMGDLDFGHYTARINVNGRWYNVNDSYVREEQNSPPIEDAYMLFYEEKKSTH